MSLTWLDLLGYLGILLSLLSISLTTMLPLRIAALSSQVVFIAYGFFMHDYLLFILYTLIFLVNICKLLQLKRIARKVQIASISAPSFDKIIPIMTKHFLRKGEVLFHKDDVANSLYYIKEGLLEIVDLNMVTTAEDVLGEVGMFTPDHKRTATVIAKTDSIIYELSEDKVKQLYFQDPSFGFSVLQLITMRLIQNERRAAMQLQRLQKPN